MVRVDVYFAQPVSRGDRAKLARSLRDIGAIAWDGTALAITSNTLRCSRHVTRRSRACVFDPSVIRKYCEGVFDRLATVHEAQRIDRIVTRAKSR